VNIPRQTLPRVICIDEIYSKTSRKNKYSCLLLDFETSNLIDVIINRRKTTLLNYFEKIPKSERENVEYVSMDLYETYRSVVKLRLPKAKVCADPLCKALHKRSTTIIYFQCSQLRILCHVK